ncbi:MAG: AAA family ATPase [Candidatus Aminicenantes bacterium]|nr:AAA family ATPase [Candidatus Aminicenantes bacterium]
MSAKSGRKSIYFLRLEIENVRCFAEKQVLDLVGSNNLPARWNLIVGDNGVGKTTLLQCLAWMRPVPYFDPKTETQTGIQPSLHDQDTPDMQRQIGIQPWLNDRDTPDMERLLRDGASPTALRAEMVELPTLDSFCSSTGRIRTGIMFGATKNKLTRVRLTENEPEKTVEPFFIPYAANRHMGHQNAARLSEAEPDDLLRTDSTELVDAADVLSRLDHSALKGNPKSKACLDSLKRALVNILPFINEASDIDVRDPVEPGGRLRFRTPYGDVSLDGLSLGHRTVTAWIVDLAWRLVKRYPESTKPLEEPAVVLIDEIDLHVHPRWQRTIMQQISGHFTNVQFVATTHSPMMVGSMTGVNVAVLRQTEAGDHVVIENEPEVVEGWRVDQILVSLFGLETARSLRVEELMKERERLLEKKSYSPHERERLREIADELSSLPTAERTEDLEAMRVIREAAADIRARQVDRK